jgi:RimJ/RimL family protein N-acetyltransferase
MRFREISGLDLPLLWEWRNDIDTRKTTSSPYKKVRWDEHVDWFKRIYPDGMWWMAHDEHEGVGPVPVGHVRFHVSYNKEYPKDWSAVVNVTVGPQFRRCGYGTRIIRFGTQKIWDTTDAFRCLAFVKDGNEASSKAFAKVGYNVVDQWRGQQVMELRRQYDEPASKYIRPS